MELNQELAKVVVKEGEYNLNGGGKSNLKIDLPRVQAHPRILRALTYLAGRIIPDDTDAIAGCLKGGALIGGIVSYSRQIPSFSIDLKERTIEGMIPESKKLLIFDDVCTTGKALRDATQIVRAEGYTGEIRYGVVVGRGTDIEIDGCRVPYVIDAADVFEFYRRQRTQLP